MNSFRFRLSSLLRRMLPPALMRRISAELWLEHKAGGRILAGPFAGMRLAPGTARWNLHAQLAGTYELELHPWIHELSSCHFDGHVHVGAGEGHYVVGLAMISSPPPHTRSGALPLK